jgi:hypothetical protein
VRVRVCVFIDFCMVIVPLTFFIHRFREKGQGV